MEAWRELFEELARSVSDVIEERASELASGRSRVGDADRGAAIARVRLWAGLPDPSSSAWRYDQHREAEPLEVSDRESLKRALLEAPESLDDPARS